MSRICFDGPSGSIEAIVELSENKKAPTALILPPHPLYGGTMQNKIVYHLYKSFQMQGISVMRMNFRGVGKSQGKFDEGRGELYDVHAALDWLQLQMPETSHFWIAGFSFGSWIALNALVRRPEIEAFITVAPPVTKYNFGFLSPCPALGLVIQGGEDEVAKPEDTQRLIDTCRTQKGAHLQYHLIEGADHFFTNHMEELKTTISDYISDRIANRVVKSVVKQRKRSKGVKKTANAA